MTDLHSKERWSPKGITTRGGGLTAFLLRKSETEDKLTSTCGFLQLECGNVHHVPDRTSSRRKVSEEGSNESLPSRSDSGGARLALLKSPITASATRCANCIRSSLKLNSDNTGASGDHRKELSSPESKVHLAQGPLARLAGQLAGEWRYDAVEDSENISVHASRTHEHSWDAGDGHTSPESVWSEIGLLSNQSLRVDGSMILATERASTLVESQPSPPEESTEEMQASDMCRETPLGDDFKCLNLCPISTRLTTADERKQQFPLSPSGETVALAVDTSNQLGDEGDFEEGYLVDEAKNYESEQGKRDSGCVDCDREDFNEIDEGEAAREIDARGESAADEGDESLHKSGTDAEDNLTAFQEDDIWSDEALISSQGKGFPPPISILASESHPGLPSHMPRTLWRSVKRDGRFVLQELQARPREFFLATRANGRLRLQLVRPDSDPVLRNPDEIEDLQLEEGGIESRQLEEDGRPRITGEDGTPGDVFDGYGPGQEGLNQYVENMLMKESSEISTTVETGQTADGDECETCSNIREITPTAYSNGDQHAQCASTFGFDSALNLLSPSKAFFQLPFTNIQSAVR